MNFLLFFCFASVLRSRLLCVSESKTANVEGTGRPRNFNVLVSCVQRMASRSASQYAVGRVVSPNAAKMANHAASKTLPSSEITRISM